MLSRFKNARKSVWFTLMLFTGAACQSQLAYGDIISTQNLLQSAQADTAQPTLARALERTDVVALLEEHGVSKSQAQARVNAMTDIEAQQLAAHFAELPAGGDVTLLLVVIILVLLLR